MSQDTPDKTEDSVESLSEAMLTKSEQFMDDDEMTPEGSSCGLGKGRHSSSNVT